MATTLMRMATALHICSAFLACFILANVSLYWSSQLNLRTLEKQFRQTDSFEDVEMECEISNISSTNSFVVTTLTFGDWLNLTSESLRDIFAPNQSETHAHYKTISLFQ
ncbi:hypothetical protein T265_13434, partial [Opisthorchis viverrini]